MGMNLVGVDEPIDADDPMEENLDDSMTPFPTNFELGFRDESRRQFPSYGNDVEGYDDDEEDDDDIPTDDDSYGEESDEEGYYTHHDIGRPTRSHSQYQDDFRVSNIDL